MDHSEKPDGIDSRASKEARDWIVRLSSGAMTDADLARFKAWRDASIAHAEAFARERLFWRQLDALAPRGEDVRAPVLRRPLDRRRILMAGGAAAAAAGLAVVATPRLKLLWNADYRTAPGEQANIALPDGSRVTLNTDSALALRRRPGLRLVELLQGEAMFDVRADRDTPFRVAALDGNTEASEAAFAVRAVAGTAGVVVVEGDVSVFAPAPDDGPPPADAIRITAGHETTYVRGGRPASAVPVDSGQALAWRSGRVIFDGLPFADALAELGRYVPERIVLGNRSRDQDSVSAIFSIRQADAAIAALARTQGLTARRIPGVIILVS